MLLCQLFIRKMGFFSSLSPFSSPLQLLRNLNYMQRGDVSITLAYMGSILGQPTCGPQLTLASVLFTWQMLLEEDIAKQFVLALNSSQQIGRHGEPVENPYCQVPSVFSSPSSFSLHLGRMRPVFVDMKKILDLVALGLIQSFWVNEWSCFTNQAWEELAKLAK